jgi:Protein of unknown function (DUF3168)
MSGPILALRRAILDVAQADAELAAAMGGHVRLHDEPPRAAEPVYGVFGSVTAKDWSTDTDRGHEQDLALVLWAKAGSSRSALLAAERLAVLLDDAALALDGHRLVNLRVTATDAVRDKESNLTRVTLRLRAVTEIL